MFLSGSIGKRTTSIFFNDFNHRLYIAGIAFALPVFFIAGASGLAGQASPADNESLSSPKVNESPAPDPNLAESTKGSNSASSSNSDMNLDNDGVSASAFSTQATVKINDGSVTATENSSGGNQSISKTLNTSSGSARVSIQQQNSTSADEKANSTHSVHVNSSTTGSSNTSVQINQYVSGGETH
jgi:hypothetical protein